METLGPFLVPLGFFMQFKKFFWMKTYENFQNETAYKMKNIRCHRRKTVKTR